MFVRQASLLSTPGQGLCTDNGIVLTSRKLTFCQTITFVKVFHGWSFFRDAGGRLLTMIWIPYLCMYVPYLGSPVWWLEMKVCKVIRDNEVVFNKGCSSVFSRAITELGGQTPTTKKNRGVVVIYRERRPFFVVDVWRASTCVWDADLRERRSMM